MQLGFAKVKVRRAASCRRQFCGHSAHGRFRCHKNVIRVDLDYCVIPSTKISTYVLSRVIPTLFCTEKSSVDCHLKLLRLRLPTHVECPAAFSPSSRPWAPSTGMAAATAAAARAARCSPPRRPRHPLPTLPLRPTQTAGAPVALAAAMGAPTMVASPPDAAAAATASGASLWPLALLLPSPAGRQHPSAGVAGVRSAGRGPP